MGRRTSRWFGPVHVLALASALATTALVSEQGDWESPELCATLLALGIASATGASEDDRRTRTAAVLDGHIGLASVAERTEEAGGTFTLESAPGTGTRVLVGLPA